MKHTTRLFTFLALFTLLPTAAHANSSMYVVSAGDTLTKIAREHQTTVGQLMQVNKLNTDRLSIGQTLTISGTSPIDQTATSIPLDIVPTTDDGTPVPPTQIMAGQKARVVVDVLNVRKSPSLEGKILGKLSFGSVVAVIDTGSEWTKIQYGDEEAFVASSFLGSLLNTAPEWSSEVDSASLKRLESLVQPLLKTPYVLGGTTPNGFDCSGFTSYVFNQLGVTLPRTSEEQFGGGRSIPLDEAQPGDLLFYDSLGKGHVSHVAIYLGDGEIVHANGDDVRYGKMEYMHKLYPFYGVKRYLEIQ